MAERHEAIHEYEARVTWTGNRGAGTSGYPAYGREYSVHIAGKPDLACSADPAFRGAAERHNPEDLFVAAIAGCHMLAYLALCARQGVAVVAYEDRATGTLAVLPEGGRFTEVTLAPIVTIADAARAGDAARLHDTAHRACFIASSCAVPIRHQASIQVATGTQLAPEASDPVPALQPDGQPEVTP